MQSGIGPSVNNLVKGYKELGQDWDSMGKGHSPQENLEHGGAIGLKALGGWCMAAGALGTIGSLVTLATPLGLIGVVSAVGLTVLGYDLAEVGSNLGHFSDVDVKSRMRAAATTLKRRASNEASSAGKFARNTASGAWNVTKGLYHTAQSKVQGALGDEQGAKNSSMVADHELQEGFQTIKTSGSDLVHDTESNLSDVHKETQVRRVMNHTITLAVFDRIFK